MTVREKTAAHHADLQSNEERMTYSGHALFFACLLQGGGQADRKIPGIKPGI
ncbi:hypothetical protein IZU99_07010 [Oscillospiraceae bacterium CM]|nr:hypothetical protein IZU99_07010 [Oscillospiraceae bacterium CM]